MKIFRVFFKVFRVKRRVPPPPLSLCLSLFLSFLSHSALSPPLFSLSHPGLGAVARHPGGQACDDPGVDVEQIVAGHAGLARHAGRDDHEVGAKQRVTELLRSRVGGHAGARVYVAEVRADALGADDVVECEVGDGGRARWRRRRLGYRVRVLR
jgi:hypothetical protein